MERDEVGRFAAEMAEDMERGVLATLWLRLRALLGSAEAEFVMGRTLLYGSGLPSPNRQHARAWLTRAATRGHARARHYLKVLDHNEPHLPRLG